MSNTRALHNAKKGCIYDNLKHVQPKDDMISDAMWCRPAVTPSQIQFITTQRFQLDGAGKTSPVF